MEKDDFERSQVGFLKSIGHESRTLLNGITGPVQLLRSISDNPNMIEPLRILDLSVSRLDNFSFRTLLLADLLSNTRQLNPTSFDIVESIKHILLELSGLLDFNRINLKQINDNLTINIVCDHELLYQAMLIIIERIISLSEINSTIEIEYVQNNNTGITIRCNDNGFIADILKKSINSLKSTPEIDFLLLNVCIDKITANISFDNTGNKSTINFMNGN